MPLKKIAIVGAAGFVGTELVTQLQNNKNYELYAVTRDNGNFLLGEKNIKLIKQAEIDGNKPFDVVINLAYPTVQTTALFPDINKNILRTLQKLCDVNTKLIHVSTQAVFGFGMEQPVVNKIIPMRRDYPYIEAKLSMEHMVKKHFPNNTSIVRLGNVWGEGSAVWTASIAERLLFGKYVGVEGKDGFANITDVKNVASYLSYLAAKEGDKGFNIYHLAEFSNLKWSDIINKFAVAMNIQPILSDREPTPPKSFKSELVGLTKMAIGDTWARMNSLRLSNSYVQSATRLYGVEKVRVLKQKRDRPLPKLAVLDNEDNTFLTVLTSKVEFKTVVDKGWTPALTFEKSWDMVQTWLGQVGYTTSNNL